MSDNFLILRKYIEQFIKLSDEDWGLLAPHLAERKIKKHGYLSREGKVAREVGFILEGEMRHYYTHNGEEKTTYFYFENMMVASYISCITAQPSQLTIQALTDTRIIVFSYDVFRQLFAKSHTWEKFGRMISEYLAIGLEERMVGLLTLTAEERYLQLLNGNKKKILERIPQHLIANYLGLTPVSLSRIRNRVLKK